MVLKNILLTLIVGLAAFVVAREHPPAAWTSLQLLGLALALIGFVLWTVARFQLGNSLTVTAQAKQLVTHGLYSKIRNPIYFFGSLFIIGFILSFGRLRWLLVFVVIVPLQIWRMRKEADVLEGTFGEEYRKYHAQTWL
jgi:protein-S-isoprenylcysteine O-methyltransferase Ste14